MAIKYIFVTGGVVSSLGKGITAASLGRVLKARGLNVSIQKLDPYLNVDPGTMAPYQHGEVFVTEDGAETDLDLGHYERFIDENLGKLNGGSSARHRSYRPTLPWWRSAARWVTSRGSPTSRPSARCARMWDATMSSTST